MSDSWHEKVRNRNREEIIEAGKKLFLKYNFIDVNIKDVCSEANVSRVTFYKYFKSIDELVFEVQMNILRNMVHCIMSSIKKESNGKEMIQDMLYAWINFAKDYKAEMKFIFLFDFYYSSHDLNEELKSKYENFIFEDNSSNFFNEAINKGIVDKSLKSDLDPIKVGCSIFQILMGVLQRMTYTNLPVKHNAVTDEDIAKSVVDMIINSIRNVDK
ncbi:MULTISPECIES: TetR/AcrR family transcriptional regulator [Clostridium]|uniref:TetR/AcrR family transcriptional regulator n=1 Tax=Clostridium TaxID=1485 RepID=UPI000825C371|nr:MULTISPECIES: TetR/AcrR family transcriptional regulator [Clostridium]PJI08652.1 TetR/AcrR family transcriptional regulator [Clostridium sp. CT7]